MYNKSSLYIPLKTERIGGAWVGIEAATKYFRNGKGISLGTLRNKICAGELGENYYENHLGQFVWITDDALNNYHHSPKAA